MSAFLPIPAIDLLGGKCVRLEQGDFERVTTYADDPTAQALSFAAAGATRLHIVDLDGARTGKPTNQEAIAQAAKKLAQLHPGTKVQVGGGLRSLEALDTVFDAGASFAVVGTAAINDPDFLAAACAKHPGKILLGLDARDGKLAVSGWNESTDIDTLTFAKDAMDSGIAGIIHTDISRDGLLTGPNLQATAELADETSCPVYASGGVASIADVNELRRTSIAGAIIGKAIYAGKLEVSELFSSSLQTA